MVCLGYEFWIGCIVLECKGGGYSYICIVCSIDIIFVFIFKIFMDVMYGVVSEVS